MQTRTSEPLLSKRQELNINAKSSPFLSGLCIDNALHRMPETVCCSGNLPSHLSFDVSISILSHYQFLKLRVIMSEFGRWETRIQDNDSAKRISGVYSQQHHRLLFGITRNLHPSNCAESDYVCIVPGRHIRQCSWEQHCVLHCSSETSYAIRHQHASRQYGHVSHHSILVQHPTRLHRCSLR